MDCKDCFKNKKILLAEDDPANQELMADIFELLGSEVEIANDGDEAILKFCTNTYDLILMDVQMPIKDGYKATVEIRRYETENQIKRTPILALTANALLGEKEKCVASGMDDYASKPIDLADLRMKMAKLLTSNS